MKSIAFDRAADEYDTTRGFPPGVADVVADAALDILGRGAKVLEVGVGTGRIAKPLLARGVRVFGLDLSRKMMSRLIETLPPGVPRPPLVEGDASRAPLASRQFDAVISVHVFHLIADWQTALAETRRILRPGGVFLTGYDWRPPDSPGSLIFDKWREIVRARGLDDARPDTRDFDDVKAALIHSGATMDERQVGEWTSARTLAKHIETIEHRIWSSTWNVPDDFFPNCLAELRAWAVEQWGGLDREFVTPHRFVWQRFSWA